MSSSHERDRLVKIAGCQQNAAWHLHALTSLKMDPPYVYPYTLPQPNSLIYIVDTYIDTNHPELKGRAYLGASFATGTHLHGTHVAALAAGRTVGVNRNATIISVQVLDQNGYGSWSTILKGLEWITRQPRGIINLSLSGPRSALVDRVLTLMIQHGWQIVSAAGNDGTDSCQSSPAGHPHSITVGAINSRLEPASFSNHGKCLDVWAPGDTILSAIPENRYAYMSGTSMAAPLVAGAWSLAPSMNRHQLVRWWTTNLSTLVPPNTSNKRFIVPIQERC